ncbi:MAG: transporter [Burkholderiales bacterium]|nr:transporter [Burkholderiales bacterium]
MRVGPAGAADNDYAPITPYRPSVSNPAQLPAPGQLEFELGGLRTRADGSQRDSLPYLLKLAFNPQWGVLLGGEAHVWLRDPSGRSQGLGDTNVVLKRAWVVDASSAFGIELGAKVATANDRIGSGRTDTTINTIYSRDLGPVHMDANLNATRLGAVDPGSARTQLGASASFSTALAGPWALTGELAGTRRRGADSGFQVLTALTYSPSKFLTFDVGLTRAVRPQPAATSLFAGVVFPIARLW